MNTLATAEAMMAAWVARDWDKVVALFAEDGVLEIVPLRAQHKGHEAIRGHLNEVAGGIDALSFDVRTLVASDNIVTFERDDVFTYNGKDARVPVVGIMEVEGDKVKAWREYFDGFTMGRAMGMDL